MRQWVTGLMRRRSITGTMRSPLMALGVLSCILAIGAINSGPTRVSAADLNEQLQIQINNGSRNTTRDEADRLMALGKTQEQDGFLQEAVQSWQQALLMYQNLQDVEAQNLTYSYLGNAYVNLGQYEAAEDIFRRRLALARSRQDYQSQIYALNSLGRILAQRGSVQAANDLYTEALTLATSINSYGGKAVTLDSLGLLAFGVGNYEQAAQQYQAALTASRRALDPVSEATILNHLGDFYLAQQDLTKAINSYGLAVKITRLNRDRPNQIHAIDGMVSALRLTRNYGLAIDLLNERLELAQSRENLRQELDTLQMLAQVQQEAGKYPDARKTYERAIEVARGLEDSQQESVLLTKLAALNRMAP